MAISTPEGQVLAFNRKLCAMAGVTPGEASSMRALDFYTHSAVRKRFLAEIRRTGKLQETTALLKRKDGSWLLGLIRAEGIQWGGHRAILTIVQDITQQHQAKRNLQGVAALLKLFTTKSSLKDYLHSIVHLLRDWCQCRCAGVRLLDEHGTMPYAAHQGFSAGFVRHEGTLCLQARECGCMRVLAGKAGPAELPRSSLHGSFFCNHTSAYAAELAAQPGDCAGFACVKARYESLAHAPVRHGNQLLGSIHLADFRQGKFPTETVEFIESVAPLIGEAIHRFRVEESLHESETRFRLMFESNNVPMLLLDPLTGALIDANPAAAALYGYSRDRLRRMKLRDLNVLRPEVDNADERLNGRNQQPFSVFLHRTAAGESRMVEIHSSPMRIKGNNLTFSIIHDVSDRRLLQKQILEVIERERQRVGRDLHDSLGGRLAGAALMSKALSQKLAKRSPAEAGLAEEVAQSINEAIAETRVIARGLWPVELTVAGLGSALQELATETARQSGVRCRFYTSRSTKVKDMFVASHLFRIVQEAIGNALRHGRPRHLDISLQKTRGSLRLQVSDDGAGFPKNAASSTGMGLHAMQFRANLIGAQLAVSRGPRGGCTVTCVFPATHSRATHNEDTNP